VEWTISCQKGRVFQVTVRLGKVTSLYTVTYCFKLKLKVALGRKTENELHIPPVAQIRVKLSCKLKASRH
jgi:hypothetical protein